MGVEWGVRGMTEYVTGQIYGWNGGKCPVHPDTQVNVWFRGQRPEFSVKADYFAWKHCDTSFQSNGDIVCFQVITPYAEPKVIWVNEYADGSGTSYSTEEMAKKYADGGYARIAVEYVEKQK